ncbi:MAG TPA: hypothetical protein VGQ02_03050 [Candidatus Limnocylindrales bacterium]|jgi:hypothetical protein|nr:hypothetical protein [Candidatus Limnocylindrales bacterium]
MTTPDTHLQAVIRTWLVSEAPAAAPPMLLERVRTRRTEVAQRRWLAYLPIPRMPAVPAFLPSLNSVTAVVVVLVTVSLGVLVVGRSPQAGGSLDTGAVPSPRPGVTIEFDITEDGLQSAQPGMNGRGSGTFTMTGSLGDQGTFTEVVSVTLEGKYEIERTLVGGRGTMVVVAAATTRIEGSSPTLGVSGTWYLADGGTAYQGVVAEGTLSGGHDSRPNDAWGNEAWVGEVRR